MRDSLSTTVKATGRLPEETMIDNEKMQNSPAGHARRLLTISQVSEQFGVAKSWLYERSRHNALPGIVRLGKYVRFRAEAIQEYIENGGDLNEKPLINWIESGGQNNKADAPGSLAGGGHTGCTSNPKQKGVS